MRPFLYLILFLASFPICSFSQGQRAYGEFSSKETRKAEEKMLKAARKEVEYGNYDSATSKYSTLLKLDSINPMYNFEQAQTLYNNYRQTESIKYYENAIKYSKDTLDEVYYFLATAYHLDGKFDNAQKNYKLYLQMLDLHGSDLMEEEQIDLKNEITHKIEMCDNGKVLFQAPLVDKLVLNGKQIPFRIKEAGTEVNSEYDDYGAVLSYNDSVIYFTSRRDDVTGRKVDFDDKFFEDIYTSKAGKNGWEKSINVGAPVNSSKHEAVISLSADGKKLYFYRGVKQGTFYYSDFTGNAWTTPKVLFEEGNMNTSSWETSFFGFTVAGNELYVVSERDSGMGKRDIYISKKQSDGAWGPLENLGAPINTKYDEDAPFITPDGKTMYFASKGHNSMGGFDIFKSEKTGNGWSAPVNLGRPFNTPGEDIYFILSNKGDCAFYSSSSSVSDGRKDMDIYVVDFCDDVENILLAGKVVGVNSGSVSVAEMESGQKIGDYDLASGKYSIPLKHGKAYRFVFNIKSSDKPLSAEISIPKQCKVYDVYQELEVSQAALVVKNAFFDIKKQAGAGNYSEFLSKVDKATPLYNEITIPITQVVLAKVDTAKTTTASTKTVTPTSTTTTTASTKTVTPASTTTTTASTKTVTPSSTTTTTATTKTVTPASTTTVTASTATVATTTTSTTTSSTSTITTISVNNILFDYDKSTMRGEFSAELDKVVSFLKTVKNAKVEVAGYTDGKGSDEYNLALSKRRANVVAAYLVSKGASKSRIKTIGYGESKPLAPNENPDGSDNPEGRAKNRRTEIVVIQ